MEEPVAAEGPMQRGGHITCVWRGREQNIQVTRDKPPSVSQSHSTCTGSIFSMGRIQCRSSSVRGAFFASSSLHETPGLDLIVPY